MNIHELIQKVIEIRHEEEHPAQELLARVKDVLQKSGWGALEELKEEIIRETSKEQRFREVAIQLEELPINWSELAECTPKYFILLSVDLESGYWIPCYNGEIGRKGFLTGGILYSDGATGTIARREGYWAHADAEGRPSILLNMEEGV